MKDKIKVAVDVQGVGVELFTQIHLRKRHNRRKPPTEIDEMIVRAEVNHGKWLVKCPWCSGAEMLDPEDLRFFCLSCFNEENGSKWIKVEMPKDKKEIEAELVKRPKNYNRNWLPNETVADLKRENRERGVD